MKALEGDAFVDASPGGGYLSTSDDEGSFPRMENTIQLAWKPSFADEYKKLLDLEVESQPPLHRGEAGVLLTSHKAPAIFNCGVDTACEMAHHLFLL